MFADDGEMLLECVFSPFFPFCRVSDFFFFDNSSGNFADELGEDFLGLRELGIDREYGLTSLTVPQSLFYGRRKRLANSANGACVYFIFPLTIYLTNIPILSFSLGVVWCVLVYSVRANPTLRIPPHHHSFL